MSNASRDANFVPTILGVSNADGSTLVPIQIDPTTHGLEINDGSTGSDLGPTDDKRDANFVPALMAVSSADGVTPVPVYADPATGMLLVKST